MRFLKSKYLILIVIALVAVALITRRHMHPKQHWVSVRVGPAYSAVYGLGTVTSDHVFNLRPGVTNSIKDMYVTEGEHVATHQALLKYHDNQQVMAPFAGTITHVAKNNHEVVDPQTPILTLTNLKDRYILVALDQDSIMQVAVGMPVRMSFNFNNQKTATIFGRVSTLYPDDGVFYAHITTASLPANVLPGMTGDTAIITKKVAKATLVPAKAIRDNQIILKTPSGKKKVTVTLGIKSNEWVQVITPVITENSQVAVSD